MNGRIVLLAASAAVLAATGSVSAALVGDGSGARSSGVIVRGASPGGAANSQDAPSVQGVGPALPGATAQPAASSTAPPTARVTEPTVKSTTALPVRPSVTVAPPVTIGPPGPPVTTPPVDLPVGPDKSACKNPIGTAQPATLADFEIKVEGAWVLCASPSVFGTQESGLEIRPDHRWSKLDLQHGRLVREQGWGNEGSWNARDDTQENGPGSYQINFTIDGSGTVISLPVFAASVPVMRLVNNGVFTADYIPASTAGVAGP